MKKSNKLKQLVAGFFLLIPALNGFAQDATELAATATEPAFQITLATIIYIFSFFLLGIAFAVWKISTHLRHFMLEQSSPEKVIARPSVLSSIFQIKSVETDKDTIIDHPHDGIYELDNPAPPWFMFLFYGTILFAVIYMFRFLISDSAYTQLDEYNEEMALAAGSQETRLAGSGNAIDENTVVYLADAADLESGKAIYDGNCKICHGDYGQGAIGPNFTDNYYLHGGDIKDIFKVIKYGVIEKGMTAWGNQLGAESMQKVASYVKSLNGTTSPVPGKEPQGELFKPETTEATASDSTAKTE